MFVGFALKILVIFFKKEKGLFVFVLFGLHWWEFYNYTIKLQDD